MEKTHKRLSYKERIVIETLLQEGKSKNYIANQLKRNRTTITREVNIWVIKPTDIYKADLAHWYALEVNKHKHCSDKINDNPRLKIFIFRNLILGTSPELIAGRLKIIYPNDPIMSISHESIYSYIYRHRQTKLAQKLIKLLPYHHHKRRKQRKFANNKTRIKDQVSIDDRPNHIELRLEVGHWEGDLMIGIGQKSAIGTIVERKTRYTFIVKLENRKSETVTHQFAKILNTLPQFIRKTMTYDNGMEMANHKWLTNNTGLDIFFAHPYSSWERGTNENTNGLIRRFLPKGTDFNTITEQELKAIENNLNNRPKKVLGYRTPKEQMMQEINDHKGCL